MNFIEVNGTALRYELSGEGARSFYYPAKPSQCADCHMPLAPSNDAGNVNGQVHSHRFPGANTAVPTANEDVEQLKITEDFLKNQNLTVDIFALSPARAELLKALPPVTGAIPSFASLSVAPGITFTHFVLIAGYTLGTALLDLRDRTHGRRFLPERTYRGRFC